MRFAKFIPFFLLALPFAPAAQTAASSLLAEGRVIDEVSGLPLNQTSVTVYDDMLKTQIATAVTDASGRWSVRVPVVARYMVLAEKPTYFNREIVLERPEKNLTAELGLSRKPGYVFDITIFDKAYAHNPINTLRDCKVEIYNNTTRQQELTIEKSPKAVFNFSFAEGNHYTVLVRKPGYLNRRVEVYVNVNGCILCVDGMGVKEPDLVPLMTHGNEIGHFLGTIDLDSIELGKNFQLANIYYDFDKWDIRSEAAKTLDKLAVFLKDNPHIKVELGSHTDARGRDEYNMSLSEKRAKSAVEYLVTEQEINPDNITAKGYGETQLTNRCDDGFSCSETEHQLNRRTTIKITAVSDFDPLWHRSLKEIIEDKNLYRKIIEQEKQSKTKVFTSRSK